MTPWIDFGNIRELSTGPHLCVHWRVPQQEVVSVLCHPVSPSSTTCPDTRWCRRHPCITSHSSFTTLGVKKEYDRDVSRKIILTSMESHQKWSKCQNLGATSPNCPTCSLIHELPPVTFINLFSRPEWWWGWNRRWYHFGCDDIKTQTYLNPDEGEPVDSFSYSNDIICILYHIIYCVVYVYIRLYAGMIHPLFFLFLFTMCFPCIPWHHTYFFRPLLVYRDKNVQRVRRKNRHLQ